jgi:hypothetical protein
LCGDSLQEFIAAVEKLTHWALVGLPEYFIQREGAYAFVNEEKGRDVKQRLLMGAEVSLNEVFNQALNLEAKKAAAGPLTKR